MPAEIVVVNRPRDGLFAALRGVPAWWRVLMGRDRAGRSSGHAGGGARAGRTRSAEADAGAPPASGGSVAGPEEAEFIAGLLEGFESPLVRRESDARRAVRIELPASDVSALLRRLRGHASLAGEAPFDLTVVDHHGRTPRFEVVYLFRTLSGLRLRVHAPIDADPPEIESVTTLWPAASWLEREAAELFGVRFRGHPGFPRLLLGPDFEGAPLRKDFERARPADAGAGG